MSAARPRSARLLQAALLVLLCALPFGCGSRSGPAHPPPRPAAGWHVLWRRVVAHGVAGVVGGTIVRPLAVEVRVEARPPIRSQVNYSIDCELSATHPVAGTFRARRTPMLVTIPLPAQANSCFLDVTASKPATAVLTVSVLARTGGAS